MKMKLLAATAILAFAAPANAIMVAGWDHNVWAFVSVLSVDGATQTDQLAAHYSDLDTTGLLNGVIGPESPWGTLFLDGQFGSVDTPLDFGATDPYAPTSLSLTTNLTAPADFPFGSNTSLVAEGWDNGQDLKMVVDTAISVVYQADLSSIGSVGSDWSVSFAGQSFEGTSNVNVMFSTDGQSYTDFGNLQLTETDTRFEAAFAGTNEASMLFVKLGFEDGNGVFIDNVAIDAQSIASVPEPGTLAMLGVGLLGLGAFGRRRA